MTLNLEVLSRFQDAADANHLLYTPIPDALKSNHSRVYTVECEGDIEAARAYMLRVLVDPISQAVVEDGTPALEGALFTIDYGMKPGSSTSKRKPSSPTTADRRTSPSPSRP